MTDLLPCKCGTGLKPYVYTKENSPEPHDFTGVVRCMSCGAVYFSVESWNEMNATEQPSVKEAEPFDIQRYLKDALFGVLEQTNLPENSAYGGVAIGGGEFVWLELRVEKQGYEPAATEQPSVKEAARVLLAEWEDHGEGLQGELAPYSLDDDGMVPDLDGGWVKLEAVTAALRSLAQGDE